jgi:DNA-binding GntR family transcriptional regulator
MLSLQSIQRGKSLYEQTYQALRASILTGELTPGDRLIETNLAEQLRVSRTPIREAIRRLQQEALVTDDAGNGLRVATVSAADAIYLYDCRIALEQLSVAGACQNATTWQLQAIEAVVTQAEQLPIQNSSKQVGLQMLELDCQFHRLIAESSGNHWLVALLDKVFDQMTLLRVQTTQHNPLVLDIRKEHRKVLESIIQRDAEVAVQSIRDHLVASKARVVQEIKSLHQNSASIAYY